MSERAQVRLKDLDFNAVKLADIPLEGRTPTVLLLVGMEEKTTKGGGKYVDASVCDGSMTVKAKIWNRGVSEVGLKEKELFTALMGVKMYNGQRSYEIVRYDEAPGGYDIGDFIRRPPYKPREMREYIVSAMKKMIPETPEDSESPETAGDGGEGKKQACLAGLVVYMYEKYADELERWSAAKTMHHNMSGGLMFHIFQMFRLGAVCAKVYGLDSEMLLAGIALHDIGKLRELETDGIGTAEYTMEGALSEHATLGVKMVEEAAAETGCDPERLRVLVHLIESHHGLPENGAHVMPATPEAFALSRLDDLDAKMFAYKEVESGLEEGEVSAKDFRIGVRVVRPRYSQGREPGEGD